MLEVALSHRFKGFDLDVSFCLQSGVTGLTGASGAGKTTIAQAISGVMRPSDGRITLGGKILLDTKQRCYVPPYQRHIGYVFQEARLFPHLSLRQNLLYGRWFARKRAARLGEPDFDQICDLLGLTPLLGRKVEQLSGGEKSRVALGRALLAKPQALLLDEPLAALDEDRKAEILPYLQRLRQMIDLPILYISHSRAELAALADRVIAIKAGRIVSDTPALGVDQPIFSEA